MKRKSKIGTTAIFQPNPKNMIVNMLSIHAGKLVRIVRPGCDGWDHTVLLQGNGKYPASTISFLCNEDELI